MVSLLESRCRLHLWPGGWCHRNVFNTGGYRMNFLIQKIINKCLRLKQYKVTRTWYVVASTPVEAIQRTKYLAHDKVEAGQCECNDDTDLL